MSLFESIGDTFFGGAEKDASKAEQKALADARRSLDNATATARGEAKGLYGGALDTTTGGFNDALRMWDRLSNRQASVLDQSNTGAQNQRIAGLGQAVNALFGNPVNATALRAPDISHNFNLDYQLRDPMDPRTDLVDDRGVPYDLQNIPYEAANIVGMLRDGNISYQEARDWLSTGAGYGSFDGLPASQINRLIANFVPGGSRYSEATDLDKLDRDSYRDAQQAWKQYYG